jgi:hypothetical protein
MKGKQQVQPKSIDMPNENSLNRLGATKGITKVEKGKTQTILVDKKLELTNEILLSPNTLARPFTKLVPSGSPKFGSRKGRLEPLSKTQVEVLVKSPARNQKDRILKPVPKNLPKISHISLQNSSKVAKFASNTETFKRPNSLKQNGHPNSADNQPFSRFEKKNTKVMEINEENESQSSGDDEKEHEKVNQKHAKKVILGKNAPTFDEWKRRNGISLNQKVSSNKSGIHNL